MDDFSHEKQRSTEILFVGFHDDADTHHVFQTFGNTPDYKRLIIQEAQRHLLPRECQESILSIELLDIGPCDMERLDNEETDSLQVDGLRVPFELRIQILQEGNTLEGQVRLAILLSGILTELVISSECEILESFQLANP